MPGLVAVRAGIPGAGIPGAGVVGGAVGTDVVPRWGEVCVVCAITGMASIDEITPASPIRVNVMVRSPLRGIVETAGCLTGPFRKDRETRPLHRVSARPPHDRCTLLSHMALQPPSRLHSRQ
jgi:hypothetical protein